MKIKVIINDGVVEAVLGDKEAVESNIDIKIVDYDRNRGNEELFYKEYEEKDTSYLTFDITHCEDDEE